MALACEVAARLGPRRGRRGRLRLQRRDGAVEVFGSPWSRPLELLGPAVVVVLLVRALLALPEERPGSGAAVAVVALFLLAVWQLTRALKVLGRARRRAGLRLDPEGLEVSGTDGRGRFLWSDLTGVGEDPLVLIGYAGTEPVALPEGELLSDPALVARLLQHYQRRPSNRAELGDGRVLDRVAGWTGVPTPPRR